MNRSDRNEALENAITALSRSADAALSKAASQGLPDRAVVVEWIVRAKRLVLMERDRSALRSEIPQLADRLDALMDDLILPDGVTREGVIVRFFERLAGIRTLLSEDVEAAFEGDPAAKSFAEIVVSYPSIRAIAVYRIAHELHLLGLPILPRMMTEYAHDRTGIDIHPGAQIGRRFFVDHGTGVVIGETAEIGDDCVMFHNVTLGGTSKHRGKRHPTLGDDVFVGTGATLLGPVHVGDGAKIGANSFLRMHDVPAGVTAAGIPARIVKRDGARVDEPLPPTTLSGRSIPVAPQAAAPAGGGSSK
jgi:serine O-acetyltransferase